MGKFYTNVTQNGDSILVREIDNGVRSSYSVDFRPTIWMNSNSPKAEWQTLSGKKVYPVQPGTISDTREFIATHGSSSTGLEIYESPGYCYQYIAQEYIGVIDWDINQISVFLIDIETEVENAFPNPETALEKIVLISLYNKLESRMITWGYKPYTGEPLNSEYRYCSTESELLRDFLSYWTLNYPDCVSGWHSGPFDVTYLYNRIAKVLGKKYADKMSPWNKVYQREVRFGNQTSHITYLKGIAGLDYLDLYKKFSGTVRESYKLDHIGEVELGEKKLQMPGNSFKDNYSNFWNIFVSYNIRDVELVLQLDNKMKLIDLALTIAYNAKINYEDVFSPVKTWDIIIYNYLNDLKMVIPIKNHIDKTESYGGGYVKEPLIGKHKWACSQDLNSLYPMLISMYNMSPETITTLHLDNISIDSLLNKEYNLEFLKDKNYAMASNGWCFDRSKLGMMPYLMQHYYNQRVEFKKAMLEAKQQLENVNAELKSRGV